MSYILKVFLQVWGKSQETTMCGNMRASYPLCQTVLLSIFSIIIVIIIVITVIIIVITIIISVIITFTITILVVIFAKPPFSNFSIIIIAITIFTWSQKNSKYLIILLTTQIECEHQIVKNTINEKCLA